MFGFAILILRNCDSLKSVMVSNDMSIDIRLIYDRMSGTGSESPNVVTDGNEDGDGMLTELCYMSVQENCRLDNGVAVGRVEEFILAPSSRLCQVREHESLLMVKGGWMDVFG